MTSNNLDKKYSLGTRIVHWMTAILILILFPLGKFMDGFAPADKIDLIQLHSSLGILLLVLTLIRVYFYFKHERPARVKTGSKLNDKLVVLVHNSFYYVLTGLALSGIVVMVYGRYIEAIIKGMPEIIKPHKQIPPLEAHELLASIVMILLTVHVIGVMKHFIFRKENIFKRMF
jgi:cytochrome b561